MGRFWGSIHNALTFSPDMQWATGLSGYAAFAVALYFCRPGMPWVVEAEKQVPEEMN